VEARRRAAELMYEPPASFGALTAAEQRQLRDLLKKVGKPIRRSLGGIPLPTGRMRLSPAASSSLWFA
jgi:hypothetical protein